MGHDRWRPPHPRRRGGDREAGGGRRQATAEVTILSPRRGAGVSPAFRTFKRGRDARATAGGGTFQSSNSSAGSNAGMGTLMIVISPTARWRQPGLMNTAVMGFTGTR